VTPRRRSITRGVLIAWAVSLVLGIVFVVALDAVPADLVPLAALATSLVGIFGVALGIAIALGWLVRLLSIGYWPRSLPGSPGDDLAPDRVFGVCVILFSLPSLLLH